MPVHVVRTERDPHQAEAAARRGREPLNAEIAVELGCPCGGRTRSGEPRGVPCHSRSPSGTRRSRSSATSSRTTAHRCPTKPPTPRSGSRHYKCLSALSQRERRVLELRYGLNGESPCTLDEVGRTFASRTSGSGGSRARASKKLRLRQKREKLRDVASSGATGDTLASWPSFQPGTVTFPLHRRRGIDRLLRRLDGVRRRAGRAPPRDPRRCGGTTWRRGQHVGRRVLLRLSSPASAAVAAAADAQQALERGRLQVREWASTGTPS